MQTLCERCSAVLVAHAAPLFDVEVHLLPHVGATPCVGCGDDGTRAADSRFVLPVATWCKALGAHVGRVGQACRHCGAAGPGVAKPNEQLVRRLKATVRKAAKARKARGKEARG